MPQLGRLICGVDVDEDGADARGGELCEDPLEPIRRPDANTIPLPHAGCEQSAGQHGCRLPQLAIRRPVVLRSDDERLAIAETLHRAAQVIADRLSEQRSRARTVQVRVHNAPDVNSDICACAAEYRFAWSEFHRNTEAPSALDRRPQRDQRAPNVSCVTGRCPAAR